VKSKLLIVLAAVPGLFQSSGQSPGVSDAPKGIQELSALIQAKPPAEVRSAIVAHFGPPQRDIGSGMRIEQWDTSDGVLTFNPAHGPTFLDRKADKLFHLLKTTNPVRTNLLQSYEMTTLPEPGSGGSMYWLGDLEFGPDMTYRFADSGQSHDHRGGQGANFFMRHPVGRVAVRYVAPISPETLLEAVPDGATIAHLTFTAGDGKNQATFSIATSERSRRLEFRGANPLTFAMSTFWNSYWK